MELRKFSIIPGPDARKSRASGTYLRLARLFGLPIRTLPSGTRIGRLVLRVRVLFGAGPVPSTAEGSEVLVRLDLVATLSRGSGGCNGKP